MSKLKDLRNSRFGRLVVIERVGSSKYGKATWLCVCDCGQKVVKDSGQLISGHSKSCGCYRHENYPFHAIKHGLIHTRLYRIWKGMKNRCYRLTHKSYENYGGRGIKVCDEWLHDFKSFYDWAMSNGYNDNLTIDRIDTDKGYSPRNCRWATYKEQNQHLRPRKIVKNV